MTRNPKSKEIAKVKSNNQERQRKKEQERERERKKRLTRSRRRYGMGEREVRSIWWLRREWIAWNKSGAVRSTGKEKGVACGLPHIIIAARHGLRHRRVAVENQITTNKKPNAMLKSQCIPLTISTSFSLLSNTLPTKSHISPFQFHYVST